MSGVVTCPKCARAVPSSAVQFDSSGTLVCSSCALPDLTADRKRSESHALSLGLTGVGVTLVVLGLKFAIGMEDVGTAAALLLGFCGFGACLLAAAGVYELILWRRGVRHSGRVDHVAMDVAESNLPMGMLARIVDGISRLFSSSRK